MRFQKYFVIIIVIIIFFIPVLLTGQLNSSGQSNPFASRPDGGATRQPEAGQPNFQKPTGFFKGIWLSFVKAQKAMNAYLSNKITEIKNNYSTISVIIILLISIVYGAFHALGPGHGKVIISSYILRENISIRQTVLLSAIVAVTHVFSALILGVIFGLISNLRIIENQETTRRFSMLLSGILIIIIGAYLTVRSIKHKECSCAEIQTDNKTPRWRLLLLGFSAGIVPCPVSLAIVIFGIYIQAFHFVLIAIIGISLGTAVTIFVLAFFVIKIKKGALNITEKRSKKAARIQRYLEYASSGFIIFFGIFIALSFFH